MRQDILLKRTAKGGVLPTGRLLLLSLILLFLSFHAALVIFKNPPSTQHFTSKSFAIYQSDDGH